MRVLITGSRTWEDEKTIAAQLAILRRQYGRDLVLGNGRARSGADAIAHAVALQLSIRQVFFPAGWYVHDREGKTPVPCRCAPDARYCPGAGYRRNQFMLDRFRPDGALAFRAAGKSNGTDDMVRRLEGAGVRTRTISEGTTTT